MEKCFGNNLEIMLRNSNMHNIGALYTNQIFDNFIKEKFYWKDFAPRNILISDDNISIVDFERGFENNDVKIFDYLMDNVYEEYAAFLLPDERLYQFEDIIAKVDERSISMSKINSKRVRMILNRLGYETEVPFSIYILAVQMIIKFEEPYLKDNDIIYPIIDLEIYLKESGYEKYVNRIMGEYNEKIKSL